MLSFFIIKLSEVLSSYDGSSTLGDVIQGGSGWFVGNPQAASTDDSTEESPEIQFDDSLFKIHLNVIDKPSNSFNGVVGFLPNENQPGKVLVTGIIYLGLNNLFNSGKQFEFDWNKLNLETQELKISYLHCLPAIEQ